ncbi:MmcQ/YjbR family DNA-binding protein [Streptococcus ictaluri]|uniref:MmcQ family protein n=1 Tax=Streptococcus ictaluri 707-05 TaxID=764299 RepID=G5K117_9STRE|nr:MmcQ/YjbR family DNA-binding protein [Streptococcus ictaluri]EHI70382.1 hypothetical protein STRIC_0293 [Streptococcus ictaluri 707-05]
MSILSTYFSRKVPLFDHLIPYGFTFEDGLYTYETYFLDGAFIASFTIDSSGRISGKVIDSDLKEPYLPLQNERQMGPYVTKVRQAYQELLNHLAEPCFKEQPFLSKQANDLAEKIAKEWSDPRDYPFEKHPEFATYRVLGKWYLMIFPLLADKLDNPPKALLGKEVTLITIKVDPKILPRLLSQDGVYPAYHMSKKHWVSIILDGSFDWEVLWQLVCQSRYLANPDPLATGEERDYWIIPANLKYYDIDAEFAANRDILWTQKASIKPGDYVLIYITAPTKAIRYLCRVLKSAIPNDGYRQDATIEQLMLLSLEESFQDDWLTFEFLKKQGINAIRGPRRATPQLIAFLKEKEYLKDNPSKD